MSIFVWHVELFAAIPSVVLKQQNAVVMIQINKNDKKNAALGTGFIIEKSGIIVTNYHCISDWAEDDNNNVVIKMDNGAFFDIQGAIGLDKENDVALIKVKSKNLPVVKINRTPKIIQGDDVFVIGNPLGLESTVSQGAVSNIREQSGIIQITAPISPGSSGSPVYNVQGEVIGVATFQTKTGQNLNFAVPINHVFRLLDKNPTRKLLTRPFFPDNADPNSKISETKDLVPILPDNMAGMKKGKVTVFDRPELGTGIGYNVPGASMTIFVYNLGMKEIPADTSSAVFKGQFDQAVGDIYQAGKMGVMENVKRMPGSEMTIMPGKSGRKALTASFTFRMQGRDMNSKLYLTQYKNNWVKLRYSYDAAMQNKGEEMFQSFLAELSAILDKGL
jgi:V8-like Glu-specific endopeptidase